MLVFEEIGEMDFVSVITDVSDTGTETGVLVDNDAGSIGLLIVRISLGRFTSSSESSLNS